MSQNESAVPEWVKKRSIEIEQEKQDRSKFYKFSKGETRILVDATKPPEQVEKFGGKTRYVYQITVNGDASGVFPVPPATRFPTLTTRPGKRLRRSTPFR